MNIIGKADIRIWKKLFNYWNYHYGSNIIKYMLIMLWFISLFRDDKYYCWEKELENGEKTLIHTNDKQYALWPINVFLIIEMVFILFGFVNSIVDWESDWWSLIIFFVFLILMVFTILARKRRREFRRIFSIEHRWIQKEKTKEPEPDSVYVTYSKTGKYGKNYMEYLDSIDSSYKKEKLD